MQNVYSVSQVNSYIKNMFSQDYMLGNVFICGEVSNVTYHSKGHIYFTLKENNAAISCVMYASSKSGLGFRLCDGQKVVAGGSVTVYEVTGKYQLVAKSIKFDGKGALAEEFERLKNQLEEMGMFAAEYKRPIPEFVKKIGVVTAPTGAAIRDIINITERRNPHTQIILCPALVQGDGAPESIIHGIHALEKTDIDVMIVGRGGGSMEDLWAFNSVDVADAIFNCSVPVISAVGHEVDFTIADFVADMRAPTPSAAAELATFEYDEVKNRINMYSDEITRAIKLRIAEYNSKTENYKLKMLRLSPVNKLSNQKKQVMVYEKSLQDSIARKISDRRHELSIYIERLKGLSPLDKLSQGYSHVANVKGETVYSTGQVNIGESIDIHVKDGNIRAEVLEVKRSDD